MEQKQAQLQIVLPQEYEDRVLAKFSQLADVAIEQAIEKASIQKRYIQQSELMSYLGCGMATIEELYANGLRYVKLGKRKLIDLEELAQVLETLKI